MRVSWCAYSYIEEALYSEEMDTISGWYLELGEHYVGLDVLTVTQAQYPVHGHLACTYLVLKFVTSYDVTRYL